MKPFIHHILVVVSIATVAMLAACSSSKNTARSRWWQAFNARYNTYYNGTLAYIDGSLEKENGNKDNFTEMIPLYTVGNKDSKELGKANFDKAIEKSEKAIKLHSIKKKPEWNKHRKKTERDIEWLNRKEYNPFLWKAWMLMGRSQFHKGDFDGAASTFSYMSRLYATQPAIYARARAWLAKTYTESGWLYDASDVIRNMRRDSIPWAARKEWDYTYADYYLHNGELEKAVPYLRRVIKHEMRKKQKARECYLLGQVLTALNRPDEAYKAFRHVIRLNPPYELAFNARIAQTEVLAGRQSNKMIGRLKRMAASDKNKDYLDQVYYAIGNIYLSRRDTASAIANYEKGNAKATRSGIEKGVLLLKLGNLYWAKEKYSDAQRCYGAAIGLLDKDRKDYAELSARSKVLDELVPYTDAIHLQDSLQTLASMSDKERNEAIDRVIADLKKKEKDEKYKQQVASAQQALQRNGAVGNTMGGATGTQTVNTARGQSGLWYFYNAIAVQQGKQQFQRLWGKRENVDNWQRANTTVVGAAGNAEATLTDEQRDSLQAVQAHEDSLAQRNDSAVNDPHKREYYMAQIPFTEEQKEASNKIIMDGLFHSGVIFKDKLDNLPLSAKAFGRLTRQYPDYENMDEAYYHLFLLYSRLGEHATAESYIEKLKTTYPNSKWTTLLTDPYFAQNAREGEQLEDSLYTATYNAFKAERYNEVEANANLSAKRFPMGANRDKFLFIGALGQLNKGNGDECLKGMNDVVSNYPNSRLAEMAGMIINGVKAGRKLRGGRFDMESVWQRRTAVMADSDSIQAKKLSNERNTPFVFMLVYQPDSVNENKLLFEVARFNFTSFLVRDFEINIEDDNGLHCMRISGFRNYDEALQYAHQLLGQAAVVSHMGKARPLVISEKNLPLLGVNYSYEDYNDYYQKHFAPLKVSTVRLLTEPSEITTQPQVPDQQPSEKEVDDYLNGFDVDLNENNTNTQTVIPVDETPQTPVNGGGSTVVPIGNDQKNANNNAAGTLIPVEDVSGNKPQGTVVPVQENTGNKTQGTMVPMDKLQQKADKDQGSNNTSANSQPVIATKSTKTISPQKGNVQKVQASEKPQQTKAVPTQPKEQETNKPTLSNGADIFFDDSDYDVPANKTDKTQSQEQGTKVKAGKKAAVHTGTANSSTGNGQQPTQSKQEKKENKQEEKFDLEDEYYDLDGF